MNRRTFIAGGCVTAVAFAPALGSQDRVFVCPPCGCASDGEIFTSAGVCPSCGMRLVNRALLDEIDGIPNFLKLEDRVWTAGQPTMDHFVKLKDEGVQTVINLRTHQESGNLGAAEESRVKELGLEYVNIPVIFGALQDATADDSSRSPTRSWVREDGS